MRDIFTHFLHTMGETTGRGKNDQTHRPNRSIKQVLAYSLTGHFRQLLQQS